MVVGLWPGGEVITLALKNLKTQRTQRTAAEVAEKCWKVFKGAPMLLFATLGISL